jgi:hypothetical protein
MLTIANACGARCTLHFVSDSNQSANRKTRLLRRLRAPLTQGGESHTAVHSSLYGLALAVMTALSLSACSDPGKTALGTNVPLATAPELQGTVSSEAVVWRSPDLAEHERGASSYLIPPATVYHGKGSNYGSLSPQEIDAIANDLTRDVRAAIGRRFKVVNAPGPGVFKLDLILVKVVPPSPAYISNGPYDWSESVIGMPNAQKINAGTMTVSGKFIESTTDKLLVGFVTPVSPQGMDMSDPSSPGEAYRFAQRASQQFATDLVAAIVRQRQINKIPVKQ